jgi:hypothetical protein
MYNVQIKNLKHTLRDIFATSPKFISISWSHYNCAHFWYPRYVLHAQGTTPVNVRNKSINTPYWTYTTGVEFKAFHIIILRISGVNWWRRTTCQRTASGFWHTATGRIMYKKVVSDKLCVSQISIRYHNYNIRTIRRTRGAHSHKTLNFEFINLYKFHRGPGQRSQYSNSLRARRSRDWTPVGERFYTSVQAGSGAH